MTVPIAQLFSLDLVKAFVAVGRRMSITQAADDLCLTQSAVSRQIRALEDQVGSKLFDRKQRGVAFTEAGERLFRTADHSVQQLQEVAADLRGSGSARSVTLTTSIGVMGLWLLPRLARLQERHPRIDVRLSASNTVHDLRADGFDLAVRYSRVGTVPGNAVRLFDETLAPVAHPSVRDAIAAGGHCPLLDYDDTRPWLQWRLWLDEGAWRKARGQVIRLNQYDQVIQAALAGQGLAIGRIELLQPLIDSKQLAIVDIPCTPVRSAYSFWLLRAEDQPREDVRRVAQWICEEAERVRAWRCEQLAPYGARAAA